MDVLKKHLVRSLVLLLALAGCLGQGNARKSIHNFVFEIKVTKSNGTDSFYYLNRTLTYAFYDNDTYRCTMQGATDQVGSYSYKRVGSNKGELINTFSNMKGEFTYTVIFNFSNPTQGTWSSTYEKNPDGDGPFGIGNYGSDVGTFAIVTSPR